MKQRRIVFTFGLLTGLFAAGYGVMFTLLDDFRDDYHIAASSLGAMVAIGFFAAFFTQILIAPMADRGHARRLVYLGMVLNVVGLVAMAFGHHVAILLAGRLVMGLGAGVAVPAVRRIVILADPDNLGQNIGRLLAADVTGFAVGPAISAVLVGPFGIAAPFLFIAVATIACFPIVRNVDVNEATGDTSTQARFAFDLLRSREYVGALCFGAAVFLMVGTFDALWVLVLDDLHTSTWIANLGITLFALPMIFLASRGGRLAQRVGPFRLGTLGTLVAAGFMFSYGRLPTGVAMFTVAMFHALNDGFTVSSSGVAVAVVAPKDRQAGAQGMFGGVQTLIGGVAALMAGWLYQHHGRAAAYTACATLMVLLTAVGLICARNVWSAKPVDDDASDVEAAVQNAVSSAVVSAPSVSST